MGNFFTHLKNECKSHSVSSMHTHIRMCMPTVPNSEAEMFNILKFPQNTQGYGCFAAVSHNCI